MRLSIGLILSAGLIATSSLKAQDQRDEDIFGEAATTKAAEADPNSRVQTLVDTLQIGGRLEIRSNTGQEEQQKFTEASFSQLKTADIYFDTRPNKDMRIFLRQRFEEAKPSAQPTGPTTGCADCIDSKIDEFWFKWDLNDQVFFTYGKQHLKWGSSRFWNPSDFTAREVRDPFALFDRRLGTEMLKIHIPQEKQGHNHYIVLQTENMRRNDDVLLALRSEFAVAGSAELAITAQTGRNHPQRLAVDLSSALGPLDVNFEVASGRRQQRQFYRGSLDPALGQVPQSYSDIDRWFSQASGGLRQTYKYTDDDTFSWGLEYFWNELGYEERDLELYALIRGDSKSLYAGRRYAGAYLVLPNPGSWNESSFYANAIGNLSDQTTVGRLTATWDIVDAATLEAFVSRCFGELGELCFNIPESYKTLSQVPGVSDEVKQVLAALPTRRTLTTAGVGLSVVF